jgi:hypothetical protein
MQEVMHLDDRGSGRATVYVGDRVWKRVRRKGSSDAAEWFRLRYSPADRLVAADRKTGRALEHAFRHPKTTVPVHRQPRLKKSLKVGEPVYCSKFGFGGIVAINGDDITVSLGKKEHHVRTQDLVTRLQAEIDWHKYWLRGEKRRLEEGKRLFIVKRLCLSEFGEWQAFLKRYDYPRSSADDLIRRFKSDVMRKAQNRNLPGNRAGVLPNPDWQINEHKADPDAEEREEVVRTEAEKRRGRTPVHHETLWSIRIKLLPDILIRCREKYKLPGAKKYWRRAAYEFIGEHLNGRR